MIEQWFSILTRKLLRRGDFTSRNDLENRITESTIGYNKTTHPWKWKYDADPGHARYLQSYPRESGSYPGRITQQNVTKNPSGISERLH
jgi:hypothetical protein